MTDCERATTLFGPAWDDELTAAERDGLERHFAACASCRREYDELARTLELVQALPRPQVDDSFAHRVLAEATAREAAAASAKSRRFAFAFALPEAWTSPSFARPALALAATLVVAIGVGAFLLNRPVSGPSPTVATGTTPASVAAPTPSAIPTESAPPPVAGVLRAAPDAPRAVPSSPSADVARRTPAASASPDAAGGEALAEATLDSLFDHAADVELVLDPVKLRRERGRGYTPSSPAVKGEAASITF